MSNPEASSPAVRYSRGWWGRGIGKACVAAGLSFVLVYLPLSAFSQRYRLLYDSVEGVNCLPYSFFLIDLHDREVHRGEYAAFFTTQLEPFYRLEPKVIQELSDGREQRVVVDQRGVMIDGVFRGVAVIKEVAGVQGDRILVNDYGVHVNGAHRGVLLHARKGGKLSAMGKETSHYWRDERVPPGHLWMMGTHERSYDSRYWGYISDEQVLGRAIPLW